jgi:hypothetical protein
VNPRGGELSVTVNPANQNVRFAQIAIVISSASRSGGDENESASPFLSGRAVTRAARADDRQPLGFGELDYIAADHLAANR